MVKIRENPIKMDDLGVPLFLETPLYTFKKSLEGDEDLGQIQPSMTQPV